MSSELLSPTARILEHPSPCGKAPHEIAGLLEQPPLKAEGTSLLGVPSPWPKDPMQPTVNDGSLSVATPEPVNQLLLNLAYEYRDLLRAGPNDEATRARIARCDEAIANGRE